MSYSKILPVILILALAGCGTLQLSPVTAEPRVIQPVTDTSKTVIVSEGMIWVDASPPTRGLRFPSGRYVLEGEDADYWYFRAPAPLQFSTFANEQTTDSRDIPGGLMLAKHSNPVPGAGYVEGGNKAKLMVWKLGNAFLRMEGKLWRRDFK